VDKTYFERDVVVAYADFELLLSDNILFGPIGVVLSVTYGDEQVVEANVQTRHTL
jgi:hypothetical protein